MIIYFLSLIPIIGGYIYLYLINQKKQLPRGYTNHNNIGTYQVSHNIRNGFIKKKYPKI